MAAGSFLVENKLRPGCYIQIKGVPKASSDMSERGTVVVLMNADSGALLTNITANDILTGGSSAKGFPLSMFTDTKGILNYVYPYVNEIYIGRLNYGGTKAQAVLLSSGTPAVAAHGSASISDGVGGTNTLVVTAVTPGVSGNSLKVVISIKSADVIEITVMGEGSSVLATAEISGVISGSSGLAEMNVAPLSNYVVFSGDSPVGLSTTEQITLSGGADAVVGDALLSANAKYDGTFGNKLSVLIVAESSGEGKYKGAGFFVKTSLDGEVVDNQNVKLPSEIKDNDYITFVKASGLSVLSAVASVDLAGGTNGTESDGNLTKILGRLKELSWNTLAFCGKAANRTVINSYINNLRENHGKYRQAVLFNHASSDYEGIISPFQAFVVDDDDIDWLETENSDPAEEALRLEALRIRQLFAVAFVAAITAGSDVNISNSHAPVPANVTAVIPAPDEDPDVEEDLRAGLLTFTRDSSNQIVIEKDINTLHTYTQIKTAPFSKNRVIRTLDELSNTKVLVWERMFIGKIDNNSTGRNLLKTQILAIVKRLADLGALVSEDSIITVEPGDDVDKVRSYETVRPIDSMEQLYSYVTVLG
jgi:hypothetical protein